jgi:hypothetical protein
MRNVTLRRVAAASTVLALGVVGVVGVAHGSHDDDKPAAAKQESAGALALRTARFRVLNATGRPLTLESTAQEGSWREEPSAIAPLRVGDYTVEANDKNVSGQLRYTIGDTKDIVRIHGQNWLVGSNLYSCDIEAPDTAYTCRIEQDRRGYNDTNFNVVVEPKEAATHRIDTKDPIARAEAMEVACGSDGVQYTGCDVARVEDVTQTLSPPTALGQKVINCGDEGTGGGPWQSATESSGTSWSLGVSSEFTLGEGAAKLVATAYLSHEWASDHSTTTEFRLSVPAHSYGWMERATPMESIRADYVAEIGNQRYEIPAVTVTTPASGHLANGMAIARTVKIPADSKVCDDDGDPKPLPIPTNPSLGQTFRIGLRGANTRRIAAGETADVPLKLAASDTADRRQQWRFDELPGSEGYFLIRSVQDPERCLDQEVSLQTVIVHKCKNGSESDVGNQLWSVVFDPETNAYQLVSKINGREVIAAGNGVGSNVNVSEPARGDYRRWEFTRVG